MRTYIKNLTAGQRFIMDGSKTVYVASDVRSGAGVTFIGYVPEGEAHEWSFSRPSLTMVTVLA